MQNLSKKDRDNLIKLLQDGKDDVAKERAMKIFELEEAESQKEYELKYKGKAREEDIIADTLAAPLQEVRTFNSDNKFDDDWTNKLIFGDNLLALKNLYEDPSIKGKVKLIYIDPPFGTGDKYGFNENAAYSAKVVGARFVDFLRKRLVLLREILHEDGCIYVRMDYHFGHYVKIILDEIFGQENFQNEIVINRFKRQLAGLNKFNVATDTLYFYSRSSNYEFNEILRKRICSFCGMKVDPIWRGMSSPGLRKPPERVIFGKKMLPPKGRHWTFTQARIELLVKEGRIRINEGVQFTDLDGNKVRGLPEYLQTEDTPVDSNWTDLKGYVFNAKYPTENPEELLERVIKVSSNENDIIMDAFAGSGTTMAVAEKLRRRWIGIDCGKMAIYTMQKRMLNLREEMSNKGKSLKTKAFTLYNAGLYDWAEVKKLDFRHYRDFVLKLFQVREEKHIVRGIEIDGYIGDENAYLWNHTKEKKAKLDLDFIKSLHNALSGKGGEVFYIIAPTNAFAFYEDEIKHDDTTYKTLRVPQSVITELIRRGGDTIKQPTREQDVNDTIDAVGFDFIQVPEVETKYKIGKPKEVNLLNQKTKECAIEIKNFKSRTLTKSPEEFENHETLSMVMVDYNYDGKVFDLDEVFYADQIKPDFEVRFNSEKIDKQMMVIYLDIFGNEKKEILNLEDFKK